MGFPRLLSDDDVLELRLMMVLAYFGRSQSRSRRRLRFLLGWLAGGGDVVHVAPSCSEHCADCDDVVRTWACCARAGLAGGRQARPR